MRTHQTLQSKELKALRYIRDRLVHAGDSPSVRDVMKHLGYKSPRSAALVIDRLIAEGFLRRRKSRELQLVHDPDYSRHERTVSVPLVGTAPCGAPLLAEENVEARVLVSQQLAKPGGKYFLLRAIGDSMDKRDIQDGDLVLVKQQPTADNGQIVVALIDDEATVKEFHSSRSAVVLKPRSSNPDHEPIVLTDNFQVQGIVVAAISNVE